MSGDTEVEASTEFIRALAEGIGPRPPGSRREHLAAEVIAAELERNGLTATIEEFASQRSFGPTYLVIFTLALLACPLGQLRARGRFIGAVAGLLAAALGAGESGFVFRSPLNLLRRRRSQNVWASIDPAGGSEPAATEPSQTICLVSHMDSSRSGLMFHPVVTPHLGVLTGVAGGAVAVNSLAPILRKVTGGRLVLGLVRMLIGASAAIVLERELRGVDVAGANDNASGVAACLNLAAHFKDERLANTRVVVLVTGSEESGVIGMRNFLMNHDTRGWLFINFDGVSAEAPLRVLSRENGPIGNRADPDLLEAAAEVGRAEPELMATPLRDGSGLPYDATAVMAKGGGAITIVNQDGAIPDYHWPTDTADKVSDAAFGRAVRFGVALVRTLDEKV